MVLSVLFWGQANAVMNVKEAKKYYPLFGIGANVALLVAGQVHYEWYNTRVVHVQKK